MDQGRQERGWNGVGLVWQGWAMCWFAGEREMEEARGREADDVLGDNVESRCCLFIYGLTD